MMEFTAEMIAGFLGGDIVGDKTVKVHTVSSIEEGKVGSMAYLVNPKYEPFLYTTEASIVLVDRSFTPQREVKPTLVKVDDAGAAVLRLLEMYNAARPQKKGVSERASISPEASLGEGCYVGDFAVIEAGAPSGGGWRLPTPSFPPSSPHASATAAGSTRRSTSATAWRSARGRRSTPA